MKFEVYREGNVVTYSEQQLLEVYMKLGVFFQVCQWWYVFDDGCYMIVAAVKWQLQMMVGRQKTVFIQQPFSLIITKLLNSMV
jgi:hypothetical protein